MTGIVFVHGIVGNNRIFDFIATHVPEGCIVKYVALDGHGGNALDFSHTSMQIWKRQLADTVKEMADVCESVIGVGHSMGCLLLLGQETRELLSGLFLLNPPLRIGLKVSMLTNALKVILGMSEGDASASAAKEAYGIAIDFNPFHYYGWPARYLELFAEIRHVRRSLPEKFAFPVNVVLSEQDEMVSVKSADVIHDKANVKVTILPDSRHYYFSDNDRHTICMAFTSLLNQCGLCCLYGN